MSHTMITKRRLAAFVSAIALAAICSFVLGPTLAIAWMVVPLIVIGPFIVGASVIYQRFRTRQMLGTALIAALLGILISIGMLIVMLIDYRSGIKEWRYVVSVSLGVGLTFSIVSFGGAVLYTPMFQAIGVAIRKTLPGNHRDTKQH